MFNTVLTPPTKASAKKTTIEGVSKFCLLPAGQKFGDAEPAESTKKQQKKYVPKVDYNRKRFVKYNLGTKLTSLSKIFAIDVVNIKHCLAYLKNPCLKLPRLVLTAPEKEDPDSIYIGTLNAQGFATEERLTFFATKHVTIISLDSRFTWYKEPVSEFEGRKATAKLYFNEQDLFDFCVEYWPVSLAANIKYNNQNAATSTATKTCRVANRNGVANVANDTIDQKAKKRATTKSYTSCIVKRNLEDVLEDGTQTKDDMSCYQFPRTEAEYNPSSCLDTISFTPRLKNYFLRPFTRWCRRSDHKVVVEYKVKKFISELTPTNSADTSAASL
ncbi:hypothetical protein DSO57_1001914 [Entomophthora muscae]|uniref:Uncharacterized protein n=1 Tax=Entomophthora muscae TaxID=34485 RepID=A0ACC2UI85_9FUNG|nr:hypothetical protein DSO57_1001914 [Entomophthora muscae]